jgi:hypothetical protein
MFLQILVLAGRLVAVSETRLALAGQEPIAAHYDLGTARTAAEPRGVAFDASRPAQNAQLAEFHTIKPPEIAVVAHG